MCLALIVQIDCTKWWSISNEVWYKTFGHYTVVLLETTKEYIKGQFIREAHTTVQEQVYKKTSL